jgi:hypothetical protein
MRVRQAPFSLVSTTTAFRLVRPVLTAHVARGLNVDEYVWDSMQEPEVFEPSPKLKK